MQSKWFSNCKTKEDEVEMRASILAGGRALERLKEIFEGKVATTTTSADYDSPSWAYKQAHANGYAEAVNDILKYLDTTG